MKPAPPRIVIVCSHPAIDRTIEVGRLGPEPVVSGRLLLREASGKGINVVHSLSNLGRHVTAIGFLGRGEKEFFLESLRRDRVTTDFRLVAAPTRENVTLVEHDTGLDLHIKVGAMSVRRQDAQWLVREIDRCVRAGDWVIFSGSSASGVNLSDYCRALRSCSKAGARVCVDASGGQLRAALRERPWLIKPNLEELEELTGRRLRTAQSRLAASRRLLAHCENVLLTLGAEGAMLVSSDGVWHARETPRLPVAHTVGCGDALVAGFVAAASAGRGPAEALRYAVACGSACARTVHDCVRSPQEPARLLRKVSVKEL